MKQDYSLMGMRFMPHSWLETKQNEKKHGNGMLWAVKWFYWEKAKWIVTIKMKKQTVTYSHAKGASFHIKIVITLQTKEKKHDNLETKENTAYVVFVQLVLCSCAGRPTVWCKLDINLQAKNVYSFFNALAIRCSFCGPFLHWPSPPSRLSLSLSLSLSLVSLSLVSHSLSLFLSLSLSLSRLSLSIYLSLSICSLPLFLSTCWDPLKVSLYFNWIILPHSDYGEPKLWAENWMRSVEQRSSLMNVEFGAFSSL